MSSLTCAHAVLTFTSAPDTFDLHRRSGLWHDTCLNMCWYSHDRIDLTQNNVFSTVSLRAGHTETPCIFLYTWHICCNIAWQNEYLCWLYSFLTPDSYILFTQREREIKGRFVSQFVSWILLATHKRRDVIKCSVYSVKTQKKKVFFFFF